mmetsp:Transcript_12150/g.31125  ORF Transcript_12150/g.31125 Transcript_12150/m.31125 type:complete len:202 (+) Transcript_12150:1252-1857(+)
MSASRPASSIMANMRGPSCKLWTGDLRCIRKARPRPKVAYGSLRHSGQRTGAVVGGILSASSGSSPASSSWLPGISERRRRSTICCGVSVSGLASSSPKSCAATIGSAASANSACTTRPRNSSLLGERRSSLARAAAACSGDAKLTYTKGQSSPTTLTCAPSQPPQLMAAAMAAGEMPNAGPVLATCRWRVGCVGSAGFTK